MLFFNKNSFESFVKPDLGFQKKTEFLCGFGKASVVVSQGRAEAPNIGALWVFNKGGFDKQGVVRGLSGFCYRGLTNGAALTNSRL